MAREHEDIDLTPSGLCAGCQHLRTQGSARGAVFFRCGRAEEDTRFRRYPPIPVGECVGFEARAD